MVRRVIDTFLKMSRRMTIVLRSLEDVPPFYVFLILACIGFIMILASVAVGVDSMERPLAPPKEVGYLYAPIGLLSFYCSCPLLCVLRFPP